MGDLKGYGQLNARLKAIGKTELELRALQLATIREAKLLVPRKTGHLGRSIVPGPVTDKYALVEARTPYAAAQELGSGLYGPKKKKYPIRPVKAKALAWGGTRRLTGSLASGSEPTHFAKLVMHPGVKPHPYLVPGAKKAVGKMKDVVVKLWNEAA